MMIAVGELAEAGQSDAVEAAISDEIAKLGASGPGTDELRKAKNQIESSLVFSLESSQGLGEAIGRAWIFTGNAATFATEADELEKVSAVDIQRVVKRYFSPDRATVVVIPPKGR
jgi:zinc protease